MKKVVILDTGCCNLTSLVSAVKRLGVEPCVTSLPSEAAAANRLFLPGVGTASAAMRELQKRGLIECILSARCPVLGICLGSQIIFDYSEEGNTNCLGLIPGTIKHFTSIKNDFPLKVPHMGWNNLHYSSEKKSPLFEGIGDDSSFYFVHSYVIQPEDESVITAWVDYGIKVPAAVAKKNILALQFHPEKSGDVGLHILENFVKLRKEDFLS